MTVRISICTFTAVPRTTAILMGNKPVVIRLRYGKELSVLTQFSFWAGPSLVACRPLFPGGSLLNHWGRSTGALPQPSRAFQAGFGAGQTAAGIVQLGVGGGGEVVGGGLDATGVGAVAGVPINVVSTAVVIQGSGNVVAGFNNFVQAVNRSPEQSSSPVTSPTPTTKPSSPVVKPTPAGKPNPTTGSKPKGEAAQTSSESPLKQGDVGRFGELKAKAKGSGLEIHESPS